MIKRMAIKSLLWLLIVFLLLLITVFIGGALLKSSTSIIPWINDIQSIPKWIFFQIRLVVYAITYWALPFLIQRKRPDAKPELITRARHFFLKMVVLYELLFGINVIGMLLS